MLKTFRDNLKTFAPVLWVVIAVFVLLMFAYPPGGTQTAPSVAATVDGREISFAEYQTAYRNLEDRFREIYQDSYTPELARQIGLPMQALNQLVAEKILLAEAEDLGLRATDREVQETILEYAAFHNERGVFDEERYREILLRNRLSISDFERDVRESILRQKFNQVLSDSVWVSDAEAERTVREETESAQIRYVLLTAADIEEEQAVTDAELADFFAEQREDYRVPEQRSLGYLTINTNVVRSSLDIPTEELRAYYTENQDEFSQPEQVRARHILLFVNGQRSAQEAQARLEEIRGRVEAGESFEDLAREFSEDEGSAERGGDLGYFGRGAMTPEFETASFGAAAGDLVGPVENQLGPRTGYHLIQIVDRRDGGVQDFEAVENRIRVRLLNERARTVTEETANGIADSLEGRTFASADELREFADGNELVGFESTEPVDRDANFPNVGRNAAFSQAAFSVEPGQLSDPVRIGSGWALVTAFDVAPPRLPELAEVEDRVRVDLQQKKKTEAALAALEAARGETTSGSPLEAVADRFGVEVQESGLIRTSGPVAGIGDDPAFNAAVLALDEGDVGGPVQTPGGAVLFEVNTRNRFDPATFPTEREATIQRLRQERVASLLQSIIERRRGEIDTTISPQLQQSFELPGADAGT